MGDMVELLGEYRENRKEVMRGSGIDQQGLLAFFFPKLCFSSSSLPPLVFFIFLPLSSSNPERYTNRHFLSHKPSHHHNHYLPPSDGFCRNRRVGSEDDSIFKMALLLQIFLPILLFLLSMASSSRTLNSLTALEDEESLIHDFDHISLNHPSDSNSLCLFFKLLTPKSCDGDRRRVLEEQPSHFDNPQLAQFIADEIGELIEIYPLSLLENFGPYLRLRILFDITKPLRHGMTIQFRGISNPKWINFKFESLSNFCYLCGLVDHTYNKCTKYLMRCDNFLLPPLLEYKETLRATTPAHHKRNPFEISNSTPYEEYFPRSIANNQILQQAVDQFLRVDTSTTGFAPPPAFVPALFSHSTIPPPIMTTSIITHTDKGKGIDVTMPSPSPPQSTRSAGPVIQEPSS
ncbi:hypothetical protein F8388_000601 [Cannabis sativa]|uniref:Zinc knuckle CX2CX4HX4C domain-containing protein n=1 Tax=Cannabis sativa TaxID=3483 RepID=A0A7J6EE93_CANSA|nr:hypothetical protein F8388_000601 [Cannabis sativa]